MLLRIVKGAKALGAIVSDLYDRRSLRRPIGKTRAPKRFSTKESCAV